VQREVDAVKTAFEWVADISSQVPPERWGTSDPPAWSARRTLDHLVDTALLYSAYIATRARDRITPPRNGDPNASPDELLCALNSATTILESLLRAMPETVRVFHPSGRADRSGWIGMACTELLVHGYDIATAAGVSIDEPPDQLALSVVERVLPWSPTEGTGWNRLLWATGRAPLGTRPPQDANWWWQSAPLDEWDGTPQQRSTPPQW
jgi:uncharacterized protein (TIGR03083 family)